MRVFGVSKQADDEKNQPDRLPDPRRLLVSGAAAMLLTAFSVVLAAFYAVHSIDHAALGSEMQRAMRALAAIGSAPGVEAQLDQDFVLEGSRFVLPAEVLPTEISIPLAGRAEVLAWTPNRIGTQMFFQLAPIRLAACAAFLLGVFLLVRRLYGMTRELDRRRREAQDLALRDPLTGLGNRLAFDGWIAAAPGRGIDQIGLLYLDLDDFKAINDRLGHGAGDELLRVVARRIAALAGEGDLVARIGGDEFAFVRPGPIDADTLAELAADVGACLNEPIQIGATAVALGSSVGAAVGRPGDPYLVAAADAALYRAKALPGHTFALAEAA